MIPLLFSLTALATPDTVEAEPTGVVDAVVVFPDRAAVTRTLEVELVQGLNEVQFVDLPATLDTRTLQAEGSGVPGAVLLGIDVSRRELVEDRRERVADLEARIQSLQDRLRALDDGRKAGDQELAFLGSVRAAAATQLSAELLFAESTATKVRDLADLLRTRVPAVQEQQRELSVQARDLTAELQALQRELSTVRGAAQWSRHDVTVQLESPEAGTGTVDLTYVVPGASWRPVYDLRAAPEASTVDIALSAMVTQTTGEDWSEVALTLSTARPSATLTPPELSPYYLESSSYAPPGARRTRSNDGFGEMPMEPEEAYDMDDEEAMPTASAAPMVVRQAEVSERAVATTFAVPGATAVPGDGTARKLLVTSVGQEVTYTHVVVPRVEEVAFLVAAGTWGEAWPLLPGTASAFLDDAYVGTQQVQATGTGGELRLGFGRDEAVAVEATLVDETTSDPDWLGKITYDERWAYAITNHRSGPVHLEVLDRVPVSRESRYVVRYLGDEPDESDADGIATFTREVPAGADLAIDFAYRIRYPRRAPPWGM